MLRWLKIYSFLKLEKKLLEIIKKENPDKIILIDYPGLNLRLAPKLNFFLNLKFSTISVHKYGHGKKRDLT